RRVLFRSSRNNICDKVNPETRCTSCIVGFLIYNGKNTKRSITCLKMDKLRAIANNKGGKPNMANNKWLLKVGAPILALTLVSACGTTNNDNNDPVEDETPIEEDNNGDNNGNNGDNNGDMNKNDGEMDREPADDNTLDRDPDSENRLDDGDDNLDETDEDRMNDKQNDDATE